MCRSIVRIAVVLLLITPFALGVYALVVAPGDRGTPDELLSLDLPGGGDAPAGQPELVSAPASEPEPTVPDPQGAAPEVEDVEPTAETVSSASPGAAPLPRPPDFFFCRIVSARDGRPLAGAKVEVFIRSFDFQPSTILRTDATGLIMYPADDAWYGFEIAPEGYERLLIKPSGSHRSEAEALVVRVRPEAVLVGRVSDPDGLPRPEVTVVVESCAYAMDDDWKCQAQIPQSLTAEADPSGRYRVANVPSEESLRVRVVSRRACGDLLCCWFPLATCHVRLEPGEERQLDFSLPNVSTLSGTVRDQYGQPVPGVNVWLAESTPLLGSPLPPSGILVNTVADAAGRYRFPAVPAGDRYVGIEGEWDRPDRSPMTDRIAPCTVPVSITGDMPEVIRDIPTYRGLFMSVRVVDHRGEGVQMADVLARRRPSEDKIEFHGCRTSDERGAVVLGPLVPGEYEIMAFPSSDSPSLASEKVVAREGDTNVTLRLPLGCRVAGRILRPRALPGEYPPCWVNAISRESDHEEETASDNEEAFSFRALRPETYDLFVQTGDGYVGVLHGLRPVPGCVVEIPAIDCRSRGGEVRIHFEGTDGGHPWKGWMTLDVLGPDGLRIRRLAVFGVPIRLLLPPGMVRLVLRDDGVVRACRSVFVKADEITQVRL